MVRWSRRCSRNFGRKRSSTLPPKHTSIARSTHPSPFVSTNVVGTWQLLEQSLAYWRQLGRRSRQAFRFLHISTDEVFGPIDAPERATESSPYRPSSPYAASKAAADHFVRSYHRTYGLPVLFVHPSNNYGPFQFPEKLDSADDSQRARRQAAADLWRRPAIARLALRRGSVPCGRRLVLAAGRSRRVVQRGQRRRAHERRAGAADLRTGRSTVSATCRTAPSAKQITHVADRPGT